MMQMREQSYMGCNRWLRMVARSFMSVKWRDDRACYYYRFTHLGKQFRKFGFKTVLEARKTETTHRRELERQSAIDPRSLGAVADEFIERSRALGRSPWRIRALTIRFHKILIPYFGATILISSLTSEQVEQFAMTQVNLGKTRNTAWHYTMDLKALLNYAVKRRYAPTNVAMAADLSMLRNRRSVKQPLDSNVIEEAAKVLDGMDRAFFDCVRFTGMRMDEANRLKWNDVDMQGQQMRIPGRKTYLAETWQPVPAQLLTEIAGLARTSEYVFPSRNPRFRGDKCYSRQQMRDKLRAAGFRITTRDLRDWFITEIASVTSDPSVVMRLARHSNLTTTTKYLRVVHDRMREAVTRLGDKMESSSRTGNDQTDSDEEKTTTNGSK